MNFWLRWFLLLLFVFVVLDCKDIKVRSEAHLIKESELVSHDLSIVQFDIYSVAGKFAPGEVFDGHVSGMCPSFPSNISLSIYLLESLPESLSDVAAGGTVLEIYPSDITCISEFSFDLTLYIPPNVSPNKYFLVARFELNVTKPVLLSSQIHVVKSIEIIQKWEDFSFLSKSIKQIYSLKITNLIDAKALPMPDDSLRIFALSEDKRLYIIDVKDMSSELTPSSVNLYELKINRPYELDFFELQDGYIIWVNDEDRKQTELLKISKDLSISFSQVINGYRKFNVFLERVNGLYLMSQSCDGSVVLYEGSASDLAMPPCDLVAKKQNTVFVFWADQVSVISQNSLTSVIIPGADYVLEMEDKYLIYSRSGISVDVFTLDREGLKRTGSINMVRAPTFDDYIPVSENSLVLLFRYGDSTTLYIWTSDQKIVHEQNIRAPELKRIISKGSKSVILLQNGNNKNIFIFDSGNFVDQVSGEIPGELIDFYYDSGSLVLFLELADRLGIYYKIGTENFLFTRERSERHKIINVSPETFVVFYTDSSGCWEKRLCKGKESVFILSRGLWNEQSFFLHKYNINQKLVGIVSSKKKIIFIMQDLDFIRFFSL